MTIVNSKSLVEAIDDTAFKLLQKIGGDSNVASELFTEQVKAFDVVVRWAEKRESLVPKEVKDSKFDGIKRDFHAFGAKGRGRGSRSQASPRADSVIEFPGADASAEPPAEE